MAKYFSIKEMCVSASYPQLVIVPQSGTAIYNNLNFLMNDLDKVRETYGKPIIVTSGYRPPILNAKVGGSPTSAHKYGLAADIKSKSSLNDNVKILEAAIESKIPFDQLIIEYPTFEKGKLVSMKWLHVGIRSNPRKQISYYDGKSYKPLKVKDDDGKLTFTK